MEKLIRELKIKIIKLLNLTDLAADDMDADRPLVGSDLGIDSIDVLEMVIMVEKDYGIKIDSRELGIKVFATLRTMAEYIRENRRELSN